MTIDYIVALAYSHLHQNQFTVDEIRDLIKQHAIEELNLSEGDAEALARKDEPDCQDQIDATAFQNFYLWYYFNQVAPPKLQPPTEINGKYELTLYAVLKIKAKGDDWPVDEAIKEWVSNCYFELEGNDHIRVVEIEFMSISKEAPIM